MIILNYLIETLDLYSNLEDTVKHIEARRSSGVSFCSVNVQNWVA